MNHYKKIFPDEASFQKGSFSLFFFSLKQILGSEGKRLSRYRLHVLMLLHCEHSERNTISDMNKFFCRNDVFLKHFFSFGGLKYEIIP